MARFLPCPLETVMLNCFRACMFQLSLLWVENPDGYRVQEWRDVSTSTGELYIML